MEIALEKTTMMISMEFYHFKVLAEDKMVK